MASTSLPPSLASWLQRVTIGYASPQRTLADVASLLLEYPSLSPRTEVLTYNNGSSELLLNIFGTLPTPFRGVTYNFPLSIWIPRNYPQAPPTLFVTASAGMLISPGNHVDLSGRCYHPYLANWANNVERSNLVDLCEVFKSVFARESPVYSKAAENAQTSKSTTSTPVPPPKPPKPGVSGEGQEPPKVDDGTKPPPLPPVPKQLRNHPRESGPVTQFQQSYGPDSRKWQNPQDVGQLSNPLSSRPPPPLPAPYTPPTGYSRAIPPHNSIPYGQPVSPARASYQMPPNAQGFHHNVQPITNTPSARRPPQDILDATDSAQSFVPINTPPRPPPNPEKDKTLSTVQSKLSSIAHEAVGQNVQRLGLTGSQREAMIKAEASMEAELAALQRIQEDCMVNTTLLSERIRMAENVINQAKTKELPDVDALLTATSIVHNQLYELICEDKAIQDCIYMLAKLLDRSRGKQTHWEQIIWQVRKLAREQFLLRATARKISDLIGLQV